MSNSISTLLLRNVSDVFGENDPVRRRAAMRSFTTTQYSMAHKAGVFRGRDEIDRIAGVIKATHLDFRFYRRAERAHLLRSISFLTLSLKAKYATR